MKRHTAKSTLVHYFRLLFEKSGINWHSDNRVEIEEIIDLIIDAAKAEIRAEMQPAQEMEFETE
jgi:hypothetical protein